MKLVAQEIGTWDVLIMAAGHISSPAPIVSADLNDYWQSYEVCIYLLHRMHHACRDIVSNTLLFCRPT